MNRQQRVVRALVGAHGRTLAEEAGIRLKDAPQPLYRLLVLAVLLSARIRGSVAVATARALHEAGLRDPRRMAEAGRQRRVDVLGRGGYRRYDERTATQLGDGAELLTERWNGDLRRMHEEAHGEAAELRRLLRETPGLGPAGTDVFLREVQRVWPEVAPYLDDKALSGAERLGLPRDPDRRSSWPGTPNPPCWPPRWCGPRWTNRWPKTVSATPRDPAGPRQCRGDHAVRRDSDDHHHRADDPALRESPGGSRRIRRGGHAGRGVRAAATGTGRPPSHPRTAGTRPQRLKDVQARLPR